MVPHTARRERVPRARGEQLPGARRGIDLVVIARAPRLPGAGVVTPGALRAPDGERP